MYQTRFPPDNGKPRLWFRCTFQFTPQCAGERTIPPAPEDWRTLIPLASANALYCPARIAADRQHGRGFDADDAGLRSTTTSSAASQRRTNRLTRCFSGPCRPTIAAASSWEITSPIPDSQGATCLRGQTIGLHDADKSPGVHQHPASGPQSRRQARTRTKSRPDVVLASGTRRHDRPPRTAKPKKKRYFAGLLGAGATGLEPAASGVTGRRSNQLSYAPAKNDARGKPLRGSTR